ncbi:4344_t:CDS:2 [Entrophospora sp. SA101]|nr:4344_t:CDS:2 [Entrophospora sp. SA101]
MASPLTNEKNKKDTLKFLRGSGFKCQAISCQKTRISKDDYCCLYHQICLAKLREKENIPGTIREIDTFPAWFNGNCGYVISENLVYEPKEKAIEESLAAIEYNIHYRTLKAAQNKVEEIKEKFQEDDLVCEPYVVSNQVGTSVNVSDIFQWEYEYSIPADLDRHFSPLDIVKVKCMHAIAGLATGKRYYHFGVVLGNDEICQFSLEKNGVRITIENYRENNYSLLNRNCEHFANMLVYGINYSEQIERSKSAIINAHRIGRTAAGGLLGLALVPDPQLNNGKGPIIKLTNEIKESNEKLGYSRADHWQTKELEARIQVIPKKDCRIM